MSRVPWIVKDLVAALEESLTKRKNAFSLVGTEHILIFSPCAMMERTRFSTNERGAGNFLEVGETYAYAEALKEGYKVRRGRQLKADAISVLQVWMLNNALR
jgi:hypothetical protein